MPDELRLDEVGKGWKVAMTTLLHERGAAEGAGSGGGALDRGPLRRARRAGQEDASATASPPGTTRCSATRSRRSSMRAEGLRQTLPPRPRRGARPITRCASRCRRKLLISELMQDAAALALEIEGALRVALPRRRTRPRRRRVAARLHELLRHHDRRRHQRGAAQHPRRARARAGEIEVERAGCR